jgi:hypothetical protein
MRISSLKTPGAMNHGVGIAQLLIGGTTKSRVSPCGSGHVIRWVHIGDERLIFTHPSTPSSMRLIFMIVILLGYVLGLETPHVSTQRMGF